MSWSQKQFKRLPVHISGKTSMLPSTPLTLCALKFPAGLTSQAFQTHPAVHDHLGWYLPKCDHIPHPCSLVQPAACGRYSAFTPKESRTEKSTHRPGYALLHQKRFPVVYVHMLDYGIKHVCDCGRQSWGFQTTAATMLRGLT